VARYKDLPLIGTTFVNPYSWSFGFSIFRISCVITNPEFTNNLSTPRKPPGIEKPLWKIATAIASSPWINDTG
jgi:hypothetical protein